MFSQQDLDIVRISRAEGIGSVAFAQLMERYEKDTSKILFFLEREKKLKIPDAKEIKNEISLLESRGGKAITILDKNYPSLLKEIDSPPPVIYVMGNLSKREYQENHIISIVGSRNCSILGKKFTIQITHDLTNRNFITISGLARGIDQVVHEETINNNGLTIAVLGSGLGYFYPNEQLGKRIIDSGGLVISELPFFTKPQPSFFPRRNRIIAGMSIATLVVEANKKSGSIITANQANKFGRTVFAVPGFPTDERSAGTNQLIKDGAIMARNIDDITTELPSNNCIQQGDMFLNIAQNSNTTPNSISNLNSLEAKILNALNTKTAIDINELTGFLSEDDFHSVLLAISELEIKNMIQRNQSGKIELL